MRHFIMKFLLVIIMSLKSTTSDNINDTCYEGYGCYSNGPPWRTPVRPIPIPRNPDVVKTMISFSTREDLHGVNISLRPNVDILQCDFVMTRPTFFLVSDPGTNASYFNGLTTAIQITLDANVFVVTYGNTSTSWNDLLQAVSDARIVAKEISRLVQSLVVQYKADPSTFHAVCEGLGAHVCGYVGKDVTRFGRITGDVDFFVNGGQIQPGCENVGTRPNITSNLDLNNTTLFERVADYTACVKQRALELFTSAILDVKCTFWGRQHISFGIQMGASLPLSDSYPFPVCDLRTCTAMGDDTDLFPARGSFYVRTSATSPYCSPGTEATRTMYLQVVQEETSISNLLATLSDRMGQTQIKVKHNDCTSMTDLRSPVLLVLTLLATLYLH